MNWNPASPADCRYGVRSVVVLLLRPTQGITFDATTSLVFHQNLSDHQIADVTQRCVLRNFVSLPGHFLQCRYALDAANLHNRPICAQRMISN